MFCLEDLAMFSYRARIAPEQVEVALQGPPSHERVVQQPHQGND